jgi:hypothetical protein
VRIARHEQRCIRELTRSIDALERELAELVANLAPRLLAEHGCGVLTAAKLIGEIAGIARFATDAKLTRIAGPHRSPRPRDTSTATASTEAATANSTERCTASPSPKGRLDPNTAAYLARKQADGKPPRSAALPQTPPRPPVFRLLQPPPAEQSPHPSTRPPNISPAGNMIHYNTPYSRLSLT